MKNLQLIITLFCLAFGTVAFGQTPLKVNFQVKELNCSYSKDAQIIPTVSGGTKPYTYKWANGYAKAVLNNLAFGSYTLTVTDVKGLTVVNVATVKQPDSLYITKVDTVHGNCLKGDGGKVIVTALGGTPPYSYQLNSNGSKSQSNILDFSGLTGSILFASAKVFDNKGCNATKVFGIKGINTLQAGYTVKPSNSQQLKGEITLDVKGGLAPYKYDIFTGGAFTNPNQQGGGDTATINGNLTLKYLEFVNFKILISDSKNCKTFLPVSAEPSDKLIFNLFTQNSSCKKNIGTAYPVMLNADEKYTYKWSNGSTDSMLINLAYGKYTVTVTNSKGISASEKFEIFGDINTAFTKIQPCLPLLSSVSITNSVNGTPPYSYQWTDGSTALSTTGLVGGFHYITTTDAAGCNGINQVYIFSKDKIDITDESYFTYPPSPCSGQLVPPNGTPPYTFETSNGKNSDIIGLFDFSSKKPLTVKVKDSKGCEGNLILNYDYPPVINLITCEGTASVSIECDDKTNYSYTWSNGATGSSIKNVPNGNYSMTLTNTKTLVKYSEFFTIHDSELCSSYISGYVSHDVNNNCKKDNSEVGLSNRIVEILPGPTYATTDKDGFFLAFANNGNYTLTTKPKNSYEAACLPPIPVSLANSATVDIPLKINTLCPYLNVDISTWILRRCQNNTYTVNYCNNGTALAKNVYVTLDLDKDLTYKSASISLTKKVGQLLTFDVGDVAVGECKQFSVTAYLECTNNSVGQTHCVKAHIFPDSLCNPPANPWSGAKVEVTGKCDTKDVILTIKNTGSKAMAATKNYLIIEDEVIYKTGTFKLNPNESFDVKMPANGKTYRIEAEQELNFSTEQSKPSAWVEACGNNAQGKFSIGYVNKFPKDDADPFTSIYCRESVASYDPNEKIAFPSGAAAQHFVLQNTDIEYELHFQNEGTDTAFTVVLRDTLDKSLNVNTLQTGASSHSYTWKVSGNGILTFTFDKINLTTKKQDEPKSQGFVKYRIAQNKDNALGTVIKNRAGIYFDINPVILTNTTTHTIGKDFLKVTGVNTPDFPDVKVKVYPNPFESAVTFSIENLENPSNETLHFYLFNFNGKIVKQAVFNENKLFLQRENIQNGVYFYQIKLGEKVVQNGKLVAVE